MRTLGKGDVSLAVTAHATAVAEIAALADAALALHVREPQALVAQIDLEVAGVEREIAGLEKVDRPHEAAIAKLRVDLQKVTQKLGNQRVADDETPALEKTQADLKAALRELENEYESPIKNLLDSIKVVEQLRPPLDLKIAAALADLSPDDEEESGGGRSRARGPRMAFA